MGMMAKCAMKIFDLLNKVEIQKEQLRLKLPFVSYLRSNVKTMGEM